MMTMHGHAGQPVALNGDIACLETSAFITNTPNLAISTYLAQSRYSMRTEKQLSGKTQLEAFPFPNTSYAVNIPT